MGDEVDFLPSDKRDSFLRVDSITFGLYSEHAKSTQNNIFAIFQGKRERLSSVFAPR